MLEAYLFVECPPAPTTKSSIVASTNAGRFSSLKMFGNTFDSGVRKGARSDLNATIVQIRAGEGTIGRLISIKYMSALSGQYLHSFRAWVEISGKRSVATFVN